MAEYIEREKVYDKLTGVCDSYCPGKMCKLTEYMLDAIEDIPTADVQPVKHGRWIDIYEYCKAHDLRPSGLEVCYWCSECDKAEKKTSDFCPNCGADMRGEDNA